MILTFLGTRANIDVRSRAHWRHSSLMVSTRTGCIVIDRGLDWRGRPYAPLPAGIFITHGHPDHVDGLRQGAPCAVYATPQTWRLMAGWPLAERRVLRRRNPVSLGGIAIEAWPVQHSRNAPAVGYRISSGKSAVFYAPDIAWLPDARRALDGVTLYVGDGSTFTSALVRRHGRELTGHAPIASQLEWCAAAGVRQAVFTHCGSGIVSRGRGATERTVREIARSLGCFARLAHDGMRVSV